MTTTARKHLLRLLTAAAALLLGILFLYARTAQAAKKENYMEQWVRKDGYMYYYDVEGNKLKGLNKIGRKSYYFDKQGRQKTGWQKIGNSYYFFQQKNGKGGCMLKNRTVNHIYLRKNGKASGSSTRLALLWRCSQIVDAHTRPTWSKSQKMSTVWSWMQSNIGYWNVKFVFRDDWDLYYATLTFDQDGGSCEGLGFIWAFLANACGASNCLCAASGGHGWAEVEGLIYDPACARYDYRRDDYYALSKSMAGVGGRPSYTTAGARYRQV